MYEQFCKELPPIRSIRGSKLAVVRPATVQVNNCRIGMINKVTEKSAAETALTYALCSVLQINGSL
jgi:hypothetical protein